VTQAVTIYGADGRPIPRQSSRDRAMRAALQHFGPGGFSGARGDKRSLKTWWPGSRSADSDSVGDLEALRGRARDLDRNSPIAAGAINTPVTSIVGHGLAVKATINREILGLDDAAAEAWERRAELIFEVFAQNCDITRRMLFAQQTELALRSELQSGDVLAVRRFKQRPGNLLGTKIQLVEADRISTPPAMAANPRVIDGVELDDDGAPVRFWVSNRHPKEHRGEVPTWTSVPAYSARTGEPTALFLAHLQRPGQTRGIPYLARVIEPLKQIERLTEAELAAAVISAFFTVFVTTENAQGLANQSTEDSSESTDGPLAPGHDYEMAPAAIVDLAEGESIETANPNRPNAQFDPFFLAIAKQIGVALEIPFEVLMKCFQASYSASRASLLEAWRAFRARRARLVNQWCQPVYAWVIEEAIARALLAAPGFFEDPLARHAWLGATWTGPSPGQIDPTKEAEAAKRLIDLGASTYTQAAAELTGTDWERNHVRLVKETAMRRAAGLDKEAVAEGIDTEVSEHEPEPSQDEPEKEDAS